MWWICMVFKKRVFEVQTQNLKEFLSGPWQWRGVNWNNTCIQATLVYLLTKCIFSIKLLSRYSINENT